MSDSVLKIGASAFYNCDKLTNIKLSESIISIENNTFDSCDKLTNINIPKSVLSIKEKAFMGCFSLKQIEISENLELFASGAFSYCTSLVAINVSNLNSNYKSVDGNVYTKDGKLLVQYAVGKKDTYYDVLDGVETIGFRAFSGAKNLVQVNLPNSLKEIDNFAFDGCTKLTKIVIPLNVSKIGYGTFYLDSKLTIYCKVSSKPSNWDKNWNKLNDGSNVPVIWGYIE